MDPPAKRLKVLSFNCWGLKFVADKRKQRLLAIADWIARSNRRPTAVVGSRDSYNSDESYSETEGYDVIALQELWIRDDFDIIALRAKEAGLLYSRYFYSGAIGAGLALLSAYPILDSFVTPYPLNGHPLHFIEGDFFAGKAVCGVTLNVDGIGKIDILNTHMYAPGGEGDGLHGAHRVSQAWELARIATEKAERGRHVIVMGDLNSQPHSIIMRILQTHGTLTDCFLQTNDPPPSIYEAEHRSLSPLEIMRRHGITCDSPLNTYSTPKLAKKSARDEVVIRGGKRLDYVLYRSPEGSKHKLAAEETRIVLAEPVHHLGVSYSDHFGLEAVLSFLPASSTHNETGRPLLPIPPPLAVEDLTSALSGLNLAYRHALAHAFTQLKLFALCIALVPTLAIAASFQPLRWLGWLWVVLGVTNGCVGITMLYTGWVGGRWEVGQLKNVVWEMEEELRRRGRV